MKKITYSVAFAMAVLCSSTAVAQQGFGTNRPDRSAAVEIRSSNKGLLIPRVKLTGLEDTSTISNPANSLLVFNDGTAISQGYYYWKADSSTANTPGKWIPFVDQSNLNFTLTSFENTMVLGLPNGDSKTADIISSIEITYPSFDTTVSNSKRIARFSVNKKDADLRYEEFFAHGLHVTNGLNGAIATSGDEVGKFVVKLGGNLTEPTTIHTQGNAVKIQGLVNQGTTPLVDLVSDSSVTALNNNVVAVGNIVDGTLKVATPKDVVTAGIQNDLTVDGTNLTSTVNSDSSTVDLTDVIRLGQETVKLISSDTSVAITSSVDTSTTNKIVTYDLKVAGVNDAIEVGNGLSKDATSRVVLGGTLDTNTTIITQGNKVHVQGLSQVTDKADKRDSELDDKKEKLDAKETALNTREKSLDNRETKLDEYEKTIDKKKEEAEKIEKQNKTITEFNQENARKNDINSKEINNKFEQFAPLEEKYKKYSATVNATEKITVDVKAIGNQLKSELSNSSGSWHDKVEYAINNFTERCQKIVIKCQDAIRGFMNFLKGKTPQDFRNLADDMERNETKTFEEYEHKWNSESLDWQVEERKRKLALNTLQKRSYEMER